MTQAQSIRHKEIVWQIIHWQRFFFIWTIIFIITGCANQEEIPSSWSTFTENANNEAKDIHNQAILIGISATQLDPTDNETREYQFLYATPDSTFFSISKNIEGETLFLNNSVIPWYPEILSFDIYQQWNEIITASRITPDNMYRILYDTNKDTTITNSIFIQLTGFSPSFTAEDMTVLWRVRFIREEEVRFLVIDPMTGTIIE